VPNADSQSIVKIDRPLHPTVLGVPFVCFVAALITDIAYAQTFDVIWKNFSDWLLAGGIIVGALAAIVGLVDLARPSVRSNWLIWPYAAAYAIAMILGLFDNLVHSRDAYGAMPAGLVLTVLTVLALVIAAFIGVPLMRTAVRKVVR